MINPKSKNDKSTGYVELFERLFPDYKINAFRVHSFDDADSLDDVYKSQNDGTNKIDLIFCVDKLNMGYHEDDMNIIIMNRPTQSDPLYIQELGRPFSSRSIYNPIIFDFVGNHLLMFETNENKAFHPGGKSNTKFHGGSLGTSEEVENSMFSIFGKGNVDVHVSEMHNIMENERIWAYENRHKYEECMSFFSEEIPEEYREERLNFVSSELQLTPDEFIEEYNAWCDDF
jgi:superfamily II DNA or RNA helicase